MINEWNCIQSRKLISIEPINERSDRNSSNFLLIYTKQYIQISRQKQLLVNCKQNVVNCWLFQFIVIWRTILLLPLSWRSSPSKKMLWENCIIFAYTRKQTAVVYCSQSNDFNSNITMTHRFTLQHVNGVKMTTLHQHFGRR